MSQPVSSLIFAFSVTFASVPPQPPPLSATKQDIHTRTSTLTCSMKTPCSQPSVCPPPLLAQSPSLELFAAVLPILAAFLTLVSSQGPTYEALSHHDHAALCFFVPYASIWEPIPNPCHRGGAFPAGEPQAALWLFTVINLNNLVAMLGNLPHYYSFPLIAMMMSNILYSPRHHGSVLAMSQYYLPLHCKYFNLLPPNQ